MRGMTPEFRAPVFYRKAVLQGADACLSFNLLLVFTAYGSGTVVYSTYSSLLRMKIIGDHTPHQLHHTPRGTHD